MIFFPSHFSSYEKVYPIYLTLWITSPPLYCSLMHSITLLWINPHLVLDSHKNGQEFLMFAADPQLGQKLGTLRCTIKLQRIPLFLLFICCRHSGMSFGLSIEPRALLRFVFVGIGGWGGVDFSCKKIHNLGWWYSCWAIGYQVFLLKLQESSHTRGNSSRLMCLDPTPLLGILVLQGFFPWSTCLETSECTFQTTFQVQSFWH